VVSPAVEDDCGPVNSATTPRSIVDRDGSAGPAVDSGAVVAVVTSLVDAGLDDAGLDDAGPVDAGPVDAGLDDAGLVDAGLGDAGLDAVVAFVPSSLPHAAIAKLDNATTATTARNPLPAFIPFILLILPPSIECDVAH